MASSRHNVILGGIFVLCLVLLLFLLNGGVSVFSWIYIVSQYGGTIQQLLAYLAVAGFATFAMKFEGISWKKIGITRHNFLLSLPVLVSLSIATTLIALLGRKWPAGSLSTQSGVLLPLPVVIAIVFIAAVAEEYIFRGYIQIGTRKHFGVMAGLVVSAAVFALAHLPSDMSLVGVSSSSSLATAIPTLMTSALSRFAFSIVAFAGMYELTGNIFVTIFVHSFYDFGVVYYPPVGGSITVILVCLILPFVIVFLTHYFRARNETTPASKEPLVPKIS